MRDIEDCRCLPSPFHGEMSIDLRMFEHVMGPALELGHRRELH